VGEEKNHANCRECGRDARAEEDAAEYAGGAGGDYRAESVGAEDGEGEGDPVQQRLCEALECEPGDLLVYEKGPAVELEAVVEQEIER
jgi:hypothetical protein